MRLMWISLGLISVALAVIGIVLPYLPTVPFLLLAAFSFSKSSSRLHNWLIIHPTFGPLIDDWNRSGAIHPKAKRIATLSMIAAIGLSFALQFSTLVIIIQLLIMCFVMLFIWTRPNG